MIEFFKKIDVQLFLLLNGSNNPFWDNVMWYVSNTIIWIPLYLLVLYFIFKRLRWNGLITFLFLVLLIVLSDQGSVHLFKNVFQRLRPCHNSDLAGLVHIVNGKCGGQFGFISSHAANTFAFATFISLFFKNRLVSVCLFIWASFVSYSRIYLGVHYPFDVLIGALFGIGIAVALFIVHQQAFRKYLLKKKPC